MNLSKNTEAQRPESERRSADRLTAALGVSIHRSAVRRWKTRGIDLFDLDAVRHAIKMQVRGPRPLTAGPEAQTTPEAQPEPMDPASLDSRIARLQSELLAAPDYESARTIRTQIVGCRDILRFQTERGALIDKEQVNREGNLVGQAIKALVLKMPSELPQQLVGLDYPAAVAKCEDYAYGILTTLSETQNPHP